MPENLQRTVLGRYQILVKLQRDLAGILNVDQLLEGIVKSAAELCGTENALIYLPDQSRRWLLLKTSTLASLPIVHQSAISIDDSLEGWVLRKEQPVILSNTAEYDLQYGKITAPEHFDMKSIMTVPLMVKDSAIGVLSVINKNEGDFSALDLELLSAFAAQVAIYIVNTQLFMQTDLISELVHELRTPLVSLNMAVHLLQREDLPVDKRYRIFEMINTEFNRLSDMTTSFLEYARLESGRTKFNPTRFDLNRLLSEGIEVMQFQADARGITLTFEAGSEPLFLSGDRDKLKQVILNLLNNAIKYNHPGGSVLISAQHTLTDLSFTIRDDGQGIPEEYMSRLFTRFFRAPNKENQAMGTGLGLTICKHIVEAHHGRLEVASEVDHGSSFTVRLPVAQEEEFIPVD